MNPCVCALIAAPHSAQPRRSNRQRSTVPAAQGGEGRSRLHLVTFAAASGGHPDSAIAISVLAVALVAGLHLARGAIHRTEVAEIHAFVDGRVFVVRLGLTVDLVPVRIDRLP